MKKYEIFTDGACLGNPGPGGYAALVCIDGERREICGGYRCTTNNRMEIMGVIAGLRSLESRSRVTVYSDSRYVVNAMTKGWVRRWRANGWMRNATDPAVNSDLWEELYQLCQTHSVTFKWVRGHAGHAENELCDALSVAASQRADLEEDSGYKGPTPTVKAPSKVDSTVDSGRSSTSVKITQDGQPCRKCGVPVEKRIPKTKLKPGQEYFYEHYFYCRGCGTMYMDESAKRYVSRQQEL